MAQNVFPQNGKSLDDVPITRRQVKSDLESSIAERDAVIAGLQQEIERVQREYGRKIQGLRSFLDYYAGGAGWGTDGAEEESEGSALERLPTNWLPREARRFATEKGRFFHVTELDEHLAVRMEECFPGSGLVLQEKAGSRTLRKLWKREELTRVTYGSHTHHYFHGSTNLVEPGIDGPRYISPRVAPPPEFLDGVEDEPPVFVFYRPDEG